MSRSSSKAVRSPDPFDWDAIADRFFSLHGDKPQAELMKTFDSSQAQISHWKTRKERIPFRVLARWTELDGVTWDWILAGVSPMRRRADAKAGAEKAGNALKPQRPRRAAKPE